MSTLDSTDFKEKKCLFASNFPNYRDEDVLTLDLKHQQVVAALASTSDWLTDFKLEDIRTWSMQDDIGQTPYFLDYFQRRGFLFVNLLKFIYHKIRFRSQTKAIKDSIIDDISIITSRWGNKSLLDNPVNQTPGNPKFSKIGDYIVNTRWMRYLYLANVIQHKNLIPENGVWVDIGSYYGGVQGLVYKNIPNSKIILVDFHHQLFRSYIYLSQLYPNSQHNLGIEATLKNSASNSFCYVHVSDFEKLSELKIDLLSNFFSFGEMKRSTFNNYLESTPVRNAKSIYVVNRFVSAPYFEPTYDNDLSILDYDFKNHCIAYFDVFPIHHYASIFREVLGVARTRNTSSSYFEMILKQKD